jgi:hypothetical protein
LKPPLNHEVHEDCEEEQHVARPMDAALLASIQILCNPMKNLRDLCDLRGEMVSIE